MKISISVKLLLLSLVMSVLFAGVATRVQAAKDPAKTAEEMAAKEKAVSQEAMRKLVQAAKEKINNTAWQIDLRQSAGSANGQKGKKGSASVSENDTLNFRNNRIESASMISNGFTPTNYTVRLKGKKNEIVIWETMQTSADKGVAFWRGEIDGDAMRGVLSWQLDDQNKQDYSFVSTNKGIAAPAPVAAPVEVQTPAKTEQPAEAVIAAEEAGSDSVAVPVPAETKAVAKETPKKKNFWNR